ncbi:hypothetical protein ES702_05933 [subsurface metagenome]
MLLRVGEARSIVSRETVHIYRTYEGVHARMPPGIPVASIVV